MIADKCEYQKRYGKAKPPPSIGDDNGAWKRRTVS